MKKITKTLIIGLDGAIPKRLYDYAMSGELPTIQKLISGGVYAENCLAPLPTTTPSNWTTIATGAWPGTHGHTASSHLPGDPLGGKSWLNCQAECIWNAVERDGKKAIVVNVPETWPPSIKSGYQLDGVFHSVGTLVSNQQFFTTKDLPMANRIRLTEAKNWKNMPSSKRALETSLGIKYRRKLANPVHSGVQSSFQRNGEIPEKILYLLALDFGDGYEKVILSEEKDVSKLFLSIKVGEWSKTIVQEFEIDDGPVKAGFKVKVLELDKEGDTLSIYMTRTYAFSFPSYPVDLASEVIQHVGLPSIGDFIGYDSMQRGWVDVKTGLEIVDLENKWLGEAVAYLLKTKEWTLFYMHAHALDGVYHFFADKMDPLFEKDEDEVKKYQAFELGIYKSLDRMIAKILSSVKGNPLVILTSDHGAKADSKSYGFSDALAKAGLTVYTENKKAEIVHGRIRRPPIDWSKTKAVGSGHIYVNLKGREPHGIVELEDYDKVRDEIISALYNYTDPSSGKKPFTLVLKKEDARIIGLYGERVGDVITAHSAEFGGVHGGLLSTAEYGIGSLKGLFIINGPGIKKGIILKRTVWLTDIVPTICYLADLPVPKDAEGSIIYQALEDPDLKLKERRTIREM